MCSIRQRPIRGELEGFAGAFDAGSAPGPGLVGGELDVFAVGGEGGDLRGDVFKRGGGFSLVLAAGGGGGGAFGECLAQGFDGTSRPEFDTRESIGSVHTTFTQVEAA